MTRSIALGLLSTANNGEQLLQILDTLAADYVSADDNSSEEIEF
jgi:hypothetical protein